MQNNGYDEFENLTSFMFGDYHFVINIVCMDERMLDLNL
jgi:hypothetical protein